MGRPSRIQSGHTTQEDGNMTKVTRGIFAVAAALAVCAGTTTSAWATVGWAGNVWPLHNSNQAPTGPLSVYAQVWKGGVTDAPGQGADISAILYYTPQGGSQQQVAMGFNGDVGSNDEYTGQIPQGDLVAGSYVDVTVVFTDETDSSTFEVVGDQSNNPPPIRYNITNVLPNAVDVTFTLCMSGSSTNGAPCVIGSAAEIGAWGTGVSMDPEGSHTDLWIVTVSFPAGSNPNFEYKFKRDACADWEFIGNRVVALPTDGTAAVTLGIDSWNNSPLGCDIGEVLSAPKEVCFRVCLSSVPYFGGVCVIGSPSQLTGWSTGVPMAMVGPDLFEACVTFAAGTPVQNVEYKFKKDDCDTWEGVGNRAVLIDNTSPATQTLLHNWDDGPGGCSSVGTAPTTWGKLKTQYR